MGVSRVSIAIQTSEPESYGESCMQQSQKPIYIYSQYSPTIGGGGGGGGGGEGRIF